jgi:macrolide-specific efflux system membrane fusion protein
VNAAWLSYQQNSATVIAPISGTITNLSLTPGTAVSNTNPSSNSTTTNSYGSIILDNSQVKVSVSVSEVDVTKIKVGQKATLTLDAFPEKTFTGHVDNINTTGTVSSGVTTYPTTISFDSAVPGIYPNMAVSATIITNVKSDVILVPTAALTTNNGSSTVRVLKNGQVQSVDVTIGDSNDTQTEITSGINEGDTVVTGQTSSTTTRSGGTGNSIFSGTRGGFGGGGRPGGG